MYNTCNDYIYRVSEYFQLSQWEIWCCLSGFSFTKGWWIKYSRTQCCKSILQDDVFKRKLGFGVVIEKSNFYSHRRKFFILMSYYIVIHPMTMLTCDARRPYRGTFSFFLSSDDTLKYENDTYTFRQHINYMFHFNLGFLKHFLMNWSWDSPSITNIRYKRDALKSHKMKLWTVNQWLSCWEIHFAYGTK